MHKDILFKDLLLKLSEQIQDDDIFSHIRRGEDINVDEDKFKNIEVSLVKRASGPAEPSMSLVT